VFRRLWIPASTGMTDGWCEVETIIVGEGLRALPRMIETGINDSGRVQDPPLRIGNRNLRIIVDSRFHGQSSSSRKILLTAEGMPGSVSVAGVYHRAPASSRTVSVLEMRVQMIGVIFNSKWVNAWVT